MFWPVAPPSRRFLVGFRASRRSVAGSEHSGEGCGNYRRVMALAARARDFFFLRQAAAEAQRRPAARREAIGQALTLGRQRAEAAEALWSNGHAAEGLRLAVDALERTLEAAEVLAPELAAPKAAAPKVEAPKAETAVEGDEASAEGADASAASDAPTVLAETSAPATDREIESPSWSTVLAARDIEVDRVRAIERVVSLARQPLPELDASVSATHAELYKELYRARADVDRALAPASLTPGQVKLKVIQRWTTAVLTLVLVAVGLFFALRTPRMVTASASSFFRNDPQFGPDKVFDDDPNTEWLLNDGQTGWIEARLSPGRSLTKVRILNGHNRHFNDRGVKELHLELYDASGQKVFEHRGELAFSESPSWVDVPVSAEGVERLRLNVTSFHRVGGALAEIAFEER